MFWHQIVVFYSISPSRNPFILEWRKKYVFLQNKTKQRLLSKRFNQYRESSFLRSAIFINDKVNITSSQEKNISFLYTLYSQFRHKKTMDALRRESRSVFALERWYMYSGSKCLTLNLSVSDYFVSIFTISTYPPLFSPSLFLTTKYSVNCTQRFSLITSHNTQKPKQIP